MADQDDNQTKEKLEEYQRRFINLEQDRKAYAEETVAIIKKQRGIIEKLKNENHQLKDVISKMNTNKQQSQTMYPKAGMGGESIDELKTMIEEERQQQQDIQKHIDSFQEKIKNKRANQGGHNAGTENESTLAKQIKILENRLDKANQKFNEAIAVNKTLRQQIDSLRRERVIFDNLYKKLEKELHEKRKQMANIIETANTAYEDRDKANDLIQSLKQQAKRESADFEKELRDLSHIMEKNKKTLDYIKLTEKNTNETKPNELMESDKFNKTKTQKMFKDRNTVNQQTLDNIQKFEEEFAKIQAATQVTDFERLVNIFIKNEENNFQMFKFVNNQSNDIEELEKEVADLQYEIDNYQGPGNNVDTFNKKKLKELEEKLTRNEFKSEQFEFRYHDSTKLIGSLNNWIEMLFNNIKCDQDYAKELAGSHSVTDGNMMIFLGIIEEKINMILQFYAKIQAERSNEEYQNQLTNLSNLSNQLFQNKQRMEQPTFNFENDNEDGEGDKILTLEDFRKKALEKLERKNVPTKSKKPLPKKAKK